MKQLNIIVYLSRLFLIFIGKIVLVEKRCLDCGELIRGRTDKKFCTDQCRNNYNNRLNRDSNNFVRNVHGLLRKNRRILSELYIDGRRKVHKDALIALGYNFTFFTHVIQAADGSRYQYCFEYGYKELENDFLELSCNSNYQEC